MGEFARYNGEEVKIGTCEEMYYLRADQRHRVQALSGNVDPVRDAERLRFRFPWPDEDHISPGHFDRFDRGAAVHGLVIPAGVMDHGKVQFTAPGYCVSLPCPESLEGVTPGLTAGAFAVAVIHRNGHPGLVRIVQQRLLDGKLMLICACGGCGAKYRVPTIEDAQPYIDACLAEAERERQRKGNPDWWEKVAQRIKDGYDLK